MPLCSRFATAFCKCCCGSERASLSGTPGRYREECSQRTRRSRRRSGDTSRRRSTSPKSRISNRSRRTATPSRNPVEWEIATAYLGLVPLGVDPSVPDDTSWHPVDDLPPTAFDHGAIIHSARDRLRGKLSYTNIGFALAPATFTLTELRDVYAAALGYDVSATNLKRVLLRRGAIDADRGAGVIRDGQEGVRPRSSLTRSRRSRSPTRSRPCVRPSKPAVTR